MTGSSTSSPSTSGPSTSEGAPKSYTAELVVIWTVVGVPLVYGVFHAIKAALQLFTG